MEKTSRRSVLRAAAAGGVAVAGLGAAITSQRSAAAYGAENVAQPGHGHGSAGPLSGEHAQATVSFGQWDGNNFDRQPVNSDRFRNVHQLLPFEVTIDEGGAVTFIISGLHQVLVYSEQTTLADVQQAAEAGSVVVGGPPAPPLVEYATGRVYRGLDPRVLTYATLVPNPNGPQPPMVNLLVQDRVEGVNFPNAGRYLVVCGVVPHLLEGMHGYVNVREKRPE